MQKEQPCGREVGRGRLSRRTIVLEFRFNSPCLEVLRLQQDMNSDPLPILKDRQRLKDRETERWSCGNLLLFPASAVFH